MVTAAVAGLGYGLLPTLVELTADIFYAASGGAAGAVVDGKRARGSGTA